MAAPDRSYELKKSQSFTETEFPLMWLSNLKLINCIKLFFFYLEYSFCYPFDSVTGDGLTLTPSHAPVYDYFQYFSYSYL